MITPVKVPTASNLVSKSRRAGTASPTGADVSVSSNPQPGRREQPRLVSAGTLPKFQREGRRGMCRFRQQRRIPRRTFWLLGLIALFLQVAGWAPGAVAAPDRVAIQRMVIVEAMATRVPPSLALAVARVESAFKSDALSSAGARGVMQIMPKTARDEFGVDADELWDARLNVQIGVDFLEQLYDRYGRWDLALSHYNGGSVTGRGDHARPLPATRNYVKTVLSWERRYRKQAAVWTVAEAQPITGWQAARTKPNQVSRVVERDVGSRQSVNVTIVTPKAGSLRRWLPVHDAAGPRAISNQDDWTPISIRRMQVRPSLDDFTPVIRWSNG